MGMVYEAYDHELDELVAIKTLRRARGRWLAQFKREFRSLHDLAHPNLVALGELFDGVSEPFFTMELVRGVNFLDYVRGRDTGPALAGDDDESAAVVCDEARLRAALAQVALGIAALHDAGKVHRDIKPSNIMVTPAGRAVLLDFGLVAEADQDHPSTDGAVAVGTVAYMAPEQAVSKVTPAADWYSLGVILFEALTGALPHTGDSPYDILVKKQQNPAPAPRQRMPSTPLDLDALCSALLQIEAEDRPGARDIFGRLGVEGPGAWSPEGGPARVTITANAPFVGRTTQLAHLRAACERVQDGPLIYVVEGVSGVGKSQLVERFLDQLAADDPDTVILSARCYEREVVSYKAFDGIADALAGYLAKLPSAEVSAVMPAQPALLSRLFPVLKRVEAIARSRIVPDVADPHDQRLRMFAALRELFVRLGRRRRLVWFIDDLQWTDADSLVLLQDLLAHEDPLPVFMIATMRPVDSAPSKALVDRLEQLAPTERLLVDELTRGESRELAELLLPGSDPGTLDAVAADAGGHPLFLHELARHAGAAAAGATFDEMLTARIGRLSAEAQRLLRVVAVYGGPVTQDVAALAAELSTAEQIKAARVLRAAHLARTDGVRRSDRIVAFHDRVREHVSASLSESEARDLHERLALALERSGAAESHGRALVRHARAAGRHALAAKNAHLAARHAVTALAFDQAAEFFAVAIELGTHDDESLRALRIELATALMHAGRGPEAATMFMKAADGAEPTVRLDCQRQAADQWIITGHLEQGMNALRSSLTDIGESVAATPRRALARVVWNRARLRLRGMGHTRRREGQIPSETLQRLDVLRAVAHGLAMVDNIRGADFNGRYLLLALRTGEPRRLLGALGSEVVFLVSQGGRAARRGRRLFADLARLADDLPDDPYAQAWIRIADGASGFFEGRFAPALAALEDTETVFAAGPAGLTYERNNARVFRVHTLRVLGRVRDQAALIADEIRAGRQRGDNYLETTLKLLQGHALLARGELDAARASVEGATWTPPDQGFHLQHWYDLRSRVELAIYEGRAREAVDDLAPRFAALQRSMLLRVKIVRADAVSLRARLLVAAVAEGGAPDRARAEVTRIARRLDGEGAGYAAVYAQLLRAGLATSLGAGDRDDAVRTLRAAVADADEADMELHLATARDQLGALIGGDEGDGLRTEAAAYAAREGVADPARAFAMISPGVATD